MKLHGILPPIPTPFRDDRIDSAALRGNLAQWMATRITGVVVLGSNGEAPLLDDAEADEVVSVARDVVPRDRTFLVGAARESTRATIAAVRRAASMGADAVLVRTPSYFKTRMTPDALGAHYEAVADGSPVPLVLYNFSILTGVKLTSATVARLAEHPNIVGIKDSDGDMAQVADLVNLTPADFVVLVGSAPTFYTSLCLGAVGGILAVSCVLPELCAELWSLASESRHQDARRLQREITPLARLVSSIHGVAGLKAAMTLRGYIGGNPRPPLLKAPAEAVDEVRRELARLEELTSAVLMPSPR